MSDSPLRPGVLLGRYPQKQADNNGLLQTKAVQAINTVKYLLQLRKYKQRYIVNKVNQHQTALEGLSEQDLTGHITQLRQDLQRNGLQEDLIALSFATIREAAWRVLAKRHYDVQLYGGWIMINGMISEMETGQGKTLTATLPACTAALAGIPVHVMTANDYLAARDAEILRPLYERMGLSVATIIDGMETEDRQTAYSSNIVHSTSQQIAFDYLRDRIEMGGDTGCLRLQFKQIQAEQQQSGSFLLRGLCFAIIDEADSILIDEARTPLIISKSRPNDEHDRTYGDAIFLASSLDSTSDFIIDTKQNKVTLTEYGKSQLHGLVESLGEKWQNRRWREILINQALTAKYSFQLDKHYVIREGKVQIIDQNTGRLMPDRSWEYGLHQLIEAKEGCKISEERIPIARISYQSFFRRYLRLSGMSGTVTEVSGELNSVYRLRVVRIPPHKPSLRKLMPERIYKTPEQKWKALTVAIRSEQIKNRPVLIGTSSVGESKSVSDLLTEEGLPHRLLNASQDQEEAKIISLAGQIRSITVATNMAGRGTDIELGEGVHARGGLHVIATSRNEARRIDRQLYGRCARQGDAGSAEAFISLQDECLEFFYTPAILNLLTTVCRADQPIPNWLAKIILALPQKWLEYQHYRIRGQMIKQEKQNARMLAFTGRME